jgi:glycosyltransferase involved in cell wall biosynthesis
MQEKKPLRKNMKIGIFTDAYSPDINGVAVSLATAEAVLLNAGHEVFVVAPNQKFKYESSNEKHLYKLLSIKFYGEKRFRVALPIALPRAVRDLPIDIVHTQTPFSIGEVGIDVAKSQKLPLVYTHHTRYAEYAHYLGIPKSLLNFVIDSGMKQIVAFINKHNVIIAPSRGIKHELESLGVTQPIHIIPTGIDIQKAIALSKLKKGTLVVSKFISEKKPELIIFSSRLGKEKNIEFLLRAMQIVLEARPSAYFLIIGDGNEKTHLEEVVKGMGLEKRIIFAGFMGHEDMYPLYRVAKVFVFSSLSETQGLVLLEAMALGLPAVALKATGVEDLFEDGKGGFLIEENNPDIFAHAVIRILKNPSLQKIKSREATVRARDFSLARTTKKLLDLYQGVITDIKE